MVLQPALVIIPSALKNLDMLVILGGALTSGEYQNYQRAATRFVVKTRGPRIWMQR